MTARDQAPGASGGSGAGALHFGNTGDSESSDSESCYSGAASLSEAAHNR